MILSKEDSALLKVLDFNSNKDYYLFYKDKIESNI